MKTLRILFTNELHHYQKLTPESKRLLLSIFLFNLAAPILSTFINAFLWRTSHSIILVLLYNAATFIGVPLGFYLNGKLLKTFSSTTFYFIGSITQGVTAAILLFLPSVHPVLLLIIGTIFGLTSGFYWGNRVFLIINTVKSFQRIYFTSLIFISSVLSNILIPFVIGWYLVLGERTQTYAATTAYQLLGIVLMIILFFAGNKIRKAPLELSPIPYTTLKRPSKTWKKVRTMTFLMGMANSIDIVLPALMVLLYIGKEGKLGTIQAASGIFLAIALYQVAKKVDKNKRYYVLLAGVFLSLAAGMIMSLSASPTGVILYFVLVAFATPLRWTIISPVTFDVIDGEARKYTKNRYAFIFDQELFLNIGRNTSLLFIVIMYLLQPDITLHAAPLLFALPQLALLWIAASLEKHLVVTEVREKAYLYNYVMAVYSK